MELSPVLRPWEDPQGVKVTTAYAKRLLIERSRIRARLENPGGSVILMGVAATVEQATDYSSVVGNDYHLDLLEAEAAVNTLPAEERVRLLEWLDGLSPTEQAQYYDAKPGAIIRRHERAVQKIAGELGEGEVA